MKKLIALILVLVLCLSMSAVCFAGEAITTQTKNYRNLSEEGTVIEGDGYKIVIEYCGEEGKRIFG